MKLKYELTGSKLERTYVVISYNGNMIIDDFYIRVYS